MRRKESVVLELEDLDASDGSRKRSKARATRGKKVKILSHSSTKILKLAQDLLKIAKRLEMALKNIEKNVDNDDNEDVWELSMTCG